MKKQKKFFVLLFAVIIFVSQFVIAQEAGKIFTKEEADRLYGPVRSSLSFVKSNFDEIINQAESVLMFKLEQGQLRILKGERIPVYPKDASVNTKEVFSLFSISKIKELLEKGKSNSVNFENRSKEFTITNGNFVLETAWPCPPYCFDN